MLINVLPPKKVRFVGSNFFGGIVMAKYSVSDYALLFSDNRSNIGYRAIVIGGKLCLLSLI